MACRILVAAQEPSVAACGIQFPDQGSNPGSPALGGMWSLRHWTTREVPELNDVLKVPGGGGGLVSKSCLTLFDPEDCSPPDSCVHGISQARILE